MDASVRLHTAARSYLRDRWQEWADAYSRVLGDGRAEDGYHYTDEAKNIFPRYQVLDAILVDVERLDPDDLPAVDELIDRLVRAGRHADSPFTTGDRDEIQRQAMNEERERFVAWVQSAATDPPDAVPPLPYRRVLDTAETNKWWAAVQSAWTIEHGGWWEPIVSESVDEDAVVLADDCFWGEAGDRVGAATIALRRVLNRHDVGRVIELREYGPSYEVSADSVEPTYNGAEGLFTSEGVGWLLFASHEGMTALGGTILEDFKSMWPDWRSAEWQGDQ